MTRAEARALARGEVSRLSHELKVSLAPEHRARLLAAFKGLEISSKRRTVWLLDTADRALARRGVSVRLREKSKGADATVKVRPISRVLLSPAWRRSRALEVEADLVGGHPRLSASLERNLPAHAARDAASHPALARATLTALQRRFLGELGRVEVTWQALRATARAAVLLWKVQHPDFDAPLVLEAWTLGPAGRALEISVTVAGERVAPQRRALARLLRRAGVRRASRQRTKSELLLETLKAR